MLTEKYPLGNLLPKYHSLVDQIYIKKNNKGTSGKQAEEFYRYLMAEKRKDNSAMTVHLEQYNIIIKKITENILELQ